MKTTRISPRLIEGLKDNEIFVFGSNLAGIHGAGAAKTALKWGAVMGQGEGIQGQTYAIPTKDARIERTLNFIKIESYVSNFINFAKANQHLTFLVTEIGCGLAGLVPKEVAPLFKEAVEIPNIHLPFQFWHELRSIVPPVVNPSSMNQLFDLIGNWSATAFPDAGTIDHIKKLKDEADEVIKEPYDIEEYADCIIALFAGAWKTGITFSMLVEAVNQKLEVNKKREWVKLPNGTYQHKS